MYELAKSWCWQQWQWMPGPGSSHKRGGRRQERAVAGPQPSTVNRRRARRPMTAPPDTDERAAPPQGSQPVRRELDVPSGCLTALRKPHRVLTLAVVYRRHVKMEITRVACAISAELPLPANSSRSHRTGESSTWRLVSHSRSDESHASH